MPLDLAGLLHGGPPPGPQQGPPQAGGGGEREALSILRQMIDLAQNYIQAEPDPEDKATMAKVAATLHQYLAKDQADTNKLLGNQGTLAKVMSRFGQ